MGPCVRLSPTSPYIPQSPLQVQRREGICIGRIQIRRKTIFSSKGMGADFAEPRCWRMEVGDNRIPLAFVTLKVDVGNLDKAAEMTMN